ncbi:Na/Pi cotransporter family protein [Falsiroseomonas tokyonensis]|uniref:Na/Pi cotransporter family protein n=1 Tax=Falsiroseomonas tokyonensis TaxID=430521 RepID=UPI001C202EDA|nr:Na/Pi cotransporter family protein [Falsiroseomonas tokyonensis]MBU8540393.1 Na/Pi cotransporter family protein [Falsiroseomonas tokyonensis]
MTRIEVVSQAALLVELAGHAALLLWGLHMVQSGVQRGFGMRLRHVLGVGLGSRARAVLAGLAITAALQSSTATALMLGSFAAGAGVALAPALAGMLGANLGTALIVLVLSFPTGALAPGLVLGGVVAFRRGAAGRARDIGRVAIGLGLMLTSLHLLGQAMAPVESSPALHQVLQAISEMPLPNLLVAAVLAWAAHSSVAAMLFIAALAASGAVGAEACIAMVLGANLGSALNPLLAATGEVGPDRARLRVALGNLANRAVGAAIVLAVLPQAAALLGPVGALAAAQAHLAFNLGTALLAWPLLGPLSRLLERWVPDRPQAEDAGAARYLDAGALETPPVALANAAREVLRIADAVEAMLVASTAAFQEGNREGPKAAKRLDDVVDRLHRQVQFYLARIPQEALGEEEARRLAEIRAFAVSLEHAGDVLDRDLGGLATKRLRRGLVLPADIAAEITGLHLRLQAQLRLAVAVFMREDAEAARRLVREKEALRDAERLALARMAEAADRSAAEGGAAAGLLLDAVRDLRRIGAHFAMVAHPLLERRGELLPSRLSPEVRLEEESLAGSQ